MKPVPWRPSVETEVREMEEIDDLRRRVKDWPERIRTVPWQERMWLYDEAMVTLPRDALAPRQKMGVVFERVAPRDYGADFDGLESYGNRVVGSILPDLTIRMSSASSVHSRLHDHIRLWFEDRVYLAYFIGVSQPPKRYVAISAVRRSRGHYGASRLRGSGAGSSVSSPITADPRAVLMGYVQPEVHRGSPLSEVDARRGFVRRLHDASWVGHDEHRNTVHGWTWVQPLFR